MRNNVKWIPILNEFPPVNEDLLLTVTYDNGEENAKRKKMIMIGRQLETHEWQVGFLEDRQEIKHLRIEAWSKIVKPYDGRMLKESEWNDLCDSFIVEHT